VAISAASAQSTGVVWQPPKLNVPDALPKASIKKEIITTLRVENVSVFLEKTQLKTIADKLGGSIGSRGDASESLQWLCFHGSDANGRWALWLESDEMGGGAVDGFALQRISNNTKVDRRCRTNQVWVHLPIGLGIGLPESEARRILGAPTAKVSQHLTV
jgi:hypothetical protein